MMKTQEGVGILLFPFAIALFVVGALAGYIAGTPNRGSVPPQPAPITINVRVEKPEQVKPTIEALTKALPKLEERK